MTRSFFPTEIETDRLRLERLCHDTVDAFTLYEFVQRDGWRGAATDHMPWFRFDTLDEVAGFLDTAEQQWADRETARYLIRANGDGEEPAGEILGTTGFGPEFDERRAGSGIVLAEPYWENGYGRERAGVFVELTFERYDLDAYYATCAAGNEASRRMIEAYVESYGGRHEGLLRQHSPRPNGDVTDQHRFTILREEYEQATADRETLAFDLTW
ncbi:MAG: GNAT family N-acetyltransferase [Halobaculum sp.]